MLEHLRIAERDILDYCVEKNYVAPSWPQDYWPTSPAPPNANAWSRSVAAFCQDRDSLVALVNDPSIDLFSSVPSNKSHSLLREVLLVADHNAYHLGQLIYVRRLLGSPAAQ